MKLKVCYNNEIHRLSKCPDTLETLLELVNSIFHSELPETWTLQYTDTDGDNICLTTEKDYEEFMSSTQTSNSMTKVHVVSVNGLKQSVPVVEEIIIVENDNKEDEDYQVIQRQDQQDIIKSSEAVDLSEESFESSEEQIEEPEMKKTEIAPKSEEPMKSQVCIDLETLEKLVSSMVEKSLAKLTEASQQLLEKPKNAVEFQNSMLLQDDSFLSEVEKPKVSQAMKVKHIHVRCDGCGVMPIVGVRYKCQTCDNYDLCEKCEDEGQHSHHNFVKMKKCEAQEAYDAYNMFSSFAPVRAREMEVPMEKKNCYVGEEEPCDDDDDNEEEEEQYEYQYEDDSEEQCEEKNVEEPVPEAEEIAYYDKLMEKVAKMLKVFPDAKFHMLAAFVNEAPDDLDMEELVENFKH